MRCLPARRALRMLKTRRRLRASLWQNSGGGGSDARTLLRHAITRGTFCLRSSYSMHTKKAQNWVRHGAIVRDIAALCQLAFPLHHKPAPRPHISYEHSLW